MCVSAGWCTKDHAANSRAGPLPPPLARLSTHGARGMRVRYPSALNSVGLIGARARCESAAGAFFPPCGPVPDRVRWRVRLHAGAHHPSGRHPRDWRADSPKPHGPRGCEGGQRGVGKFGGVLIERWLVVSKVAGQCRGPGGRVGGRRGSPYLVTPVGYAAEWAWLVQRGGGLWRGLRLEELK